MRGWRPLVRRRDGLGRKELHFDNLPEDNYDLAGGKRDREVLRRKIQPHDGQLYDRQFGVAHFVAHAVAEMHAKGLERCTRQQLAKIVGRHDDSVQGRGVGAEPFNVSTRSILSSGMVTVGPHTPAGAPSACAPTSTNVTPTTANSRARM